MLKWLFKKMINIAIAVLIFNNFVLTVVTCKINKLRKKHKFFSFIFMNQKFLNLGFKLKIDCKSNDVRVIFV